jgi:hypothetical protein
MEVGVFVVALVLAVGIGLLRLGRAPFPTRRPAGTTSPDSRTAEPPGEVDDAG